MHEDPIRFSIENLKRHEHGSNLLNAMHPSEPVDKVQNPLITSFGNEYFETIFLAYVPVNIFNDNIIEFMP